MARTALDIEFHRVYEPDMEKMVKALKIVLESKPRPRKDRLAPEGGQKCDPIDAIRPVGGDVGK